MRPNWEGETCSICTREQRLAWSVSDALWGKVVIAYYRNSILCLECFLRMAEDEGTVVGRADIEICAVIGEVIV